MRLTAHFHEQWPTEPQLLTDLGKIFAPATLVPVMAAIHAGGVLVTARFNERELAAAVMRLGGDEGSLSFIEVREVTRRRGVGRFVVECAAQRARQHGCKRLLLQAVDTPAAQAFAAACGAVRGDEGYALALSTS